MRPHGLKALVRDPNSPDIEVDASRAHQREMDAEIATEQIEAAEIPLLDCDPWCPSCNGDCDGLGPFVHEVTPFEMRIRRDALPRVGDVVRERFEALVRHGSWERAALCHEPDAEVAGDGTLLLDWTLAGARLRIRLDLADDDSGWSFAAAVGGATMSSSGSLATVGRGIALLRAYAPVPK